MGSKLKAGSSVPFVLSGYRDQPDAVRYSLCVLSADANDKILDLRDDYIAAKGDKAKQRELRAAMLSISVVGMQPEEITATITDRECWELIAAAITCASLTVDERKKFALQCLSETASSAEIVEASAETE